MSEIPSSDWTWIDAAAMRFEQAWKQGPRPRIEYFLLEVPEAQWPPLLEELMRLEAELRHRQGETPSAEEFHRRFPDHEDIVATVFRERPLSAKRLVQGLPSGALRASKSSAALRSSTLPAELANHPDYEIVRELGAGGMGVVFLAHNRILERDEVLKVMGPQIVEQPGVMDRFLREIRAVAKLRHPNIVNAYSAFRSGSSFVFAMEYVHGLDLRKVVTARGPMPVGHACYYVHKAALGLQHAHEEGMVHRDIKPSNLMLSHQKDRAVIKVLDFGLAKANSEHYVRGGRTDEPKLEGELANRLTLSGYMLGTPDFVAPEQIVDAQNADIRADIYSLGCTLYYLLSGHPPFEGPIHSVLEAHQAFNAVRLDSIRPDVSAELAALVAKMMAKARALRFQEPGEVAENLSQFFKHPIAAPPTTQLGSAECEKPGRGVSSVLTTVADPGVCPPATADTKPNAIEPKSSAIMPKALGGSDPSALAEARPLHPSWRSIRAVAAASAGLFAVLVVAVALSLRSGRERGTSRAPFPVRGKTVMVDDDSKNVESPEPVRRADTPPPENASVSGGHAENVPVKIGAEDQSTAAHAKSLIAGSKSLSPDSKREASPRKRDETVKAEPGREIARAEKASPEHPKMIAKELNKKMHWTESVYVMDAEDELREGAAAATERFNKYLRTFFDFNSLRGDHAEKTAAVATLTQQKAALGEEETWIRARMQLLENLAVAKRQERRQLEGLSLTPTSIVMGVISRLDEDIAAINTETLQRRDRLQTIPGERLELDRRLELLGKLTVAPAEIQELQKSIGLRRDEYILSLQALRESVDLMKQSYRDKEDDPAVKAKLAAKNKGLPRRRYRLGPSPRFFDIERKLKQHEDWVKSTRRRGTSKASSPASGRLPPRF
jgi:serine/threonine protein kinase